MMIRATCDHSSQQKYGKDRHGHQRLKCNLCGQTWTDRGLKLLGDMRIPLDKAVMALRMLLEDMSIRSVERLTGLNRNTIMDLIVLVGNRARQFWSSRMVSIPCERIQVDEIWGFVHCKERTRKQLERPDETGDAWCFTGIDPQTKLLITWHVGKRTPEDCRWFCEGLARATSGHTQITTDGYAPYGLAITEEFRHRADFAQLVKIFTQLMPLQERRYSTPTIRATRRRVILGNPDPKHVSTSMVERSNLTWRMRCRRLTRLTNAHSKKWQNHEAAMALTFAAYNFCTVHTTLKTTPAVKHGLTDHVWSIEELLTELAAHD